MGTPVQYHLDIVCAQLGISEAEKADSRQAVADETNLPPKAEMAGHPYLPYGLWYGFRLQWAVCPFKKKCWFKRRSRRISMDGSRISMNNYFISENEII